MSVKPLSRYPREYAALFRRARRAPVRVPLATPEAAKNFRRSLYNFRQALADAEGRVPGYEDIMLLAPLAQMRIEGSTLILSYPENPNAKPHPSRRKR